MEWITGLQRAIEYIEENLCEELDYSEIAKQAYSSSFHFQRVFGILCGYTLGEYIRYRRLTLAGSDLLNTDSKVIDIAIKYGYDCPESFGRAFLKFHCITPSQAKNGRSNLKSFSRLSVKLILNGGNIMNYRIEKKEAFKIICRKEFFSSDNEINKKQIPEFWIRCKTDGTIQNLCRYMTKENVFGDSVVGACFGNEVNETHFPYAIGVAYNEGEIEEGYSVEEIPAHTWVIFKCKGPMPEQH